MSGPPPSRPLGGMHDPAADIKLVNDTIQKHLNKSLAPEDRATLEAANRKLVLHTSTGFWLGTMAGAGWAFRSRWAALANLRRAAANNATAASGGSFYPGRNPKSVNEIKQVVEQATGGTKAAEGGKMGGVVRAMGWGMLGAFVGSQAGLWSGRRSAQNVVTSSGHEERIQKNLALAMRNAAMEVSTKSGKPIKSFKLPGMSDQDWDEKDEEDGDHVQEEEREEAALAPPEGFYAKNAVDDQSNERPAPDSGNASSGRWDELRRSKPATPSTWDEIRDSSARASLPNSGRSSASAASLPTYDQPQDDDRQSEKARREREFAELMEKERKGGDESFGNDSKWR